MKLTKTQYDTDVVAWSDQQSELLRDRNWQALDLENLIEEITDIGNRHRDALESHLENLLMHRLKQHFQAEKATRAWEISLQNAAREIWKHLSLQSHFELCFDEVYSDAREAAAIETGLSIDDFPRDCSSEMSLEVFGIIEKLE